MDLMGTAQLAVQAMPRDMGRGQGDLVRQYLVDGGLFLPHVEQCGEVITASQASAQRLTVDAVATSGIEQQRTGRQRLDAPGVEQVASSVASLAHQRGMQAQHVAAVDQGVQLDKVLAVLVTGSAAGFPLGPGRVAQPVLDAHGGQTGRQPAAYIADADDTHATLEQRLTTTLAGQHQRRQHVVHHRLGIAARGACEGDGMARQGGLVDMVGANGATADKRQRRALGLGGLDQIGVETRDRANHQGIHIGQAVGVDLAPRPAADLAKRRKAGIGGGHVGIDKNLHGVPRVAGIGLPVMQPGYLWISLKGLQCP